MTGSDAHSDATGTLARVRWIGGGSGAGKTTLGQRLARRHGAILYSTDDTLRDHAARCTKLDCPRLDVFKQMSLDERWVTRTPDEMLESFPWFAGEGFSLILRDLQALPCNVPVIAEGFRLLPHLVAPMLDDPRRAVWLLPTPEFRRHAFDARGSTWDIAGRTSDPERALANLLARDDLFTERVAKDCAALGLAGLVVDGSSPEDNLCNQLDRLLF